MCLYKAVLESKCFVFYSELHVYEKMLNRNVLFSVNSYLVIVYDRLPHNIVFHQEFIIVLYFGAKNIVLGGKDRVRVIYPTTWATVDITVLRTFKWNSTLSWLGDVEIYLDLEMIFFLFLYCNLQNYRNELHKAVYFYSFINCILNQNLQVII